MVRSAPLAGVAATMRRNSLSEAHTKQLDLEDAVKNLTDRVTRIEQIVPTLATKADLEVLRLATRVDVREEGERTRRHFDVVGERLEGHIRVIADGHVSLQEKLEAFRKDVEGVLRFSGSFKPYGQEDARETKTRRRIGRNAG